MDSDRNLWVCQGCGSDDVSLLQLNSGEHYNTGGHTCSNCGFVYENIDIYDVMDYSKQSSEDTGPAKKRFKESYQRRVSGRVAGVLCRASWRDMGRRYTIGELTLTLGPFA